MQQNCNVQIRELEQDEKDVVFEPLIKPDLNFFKDTRKICISHTHCLCDILMNIHLVSKGLRRMCLFCRRSIPSKLSHWLHTNGHKYNVRLITDDKDNCYIVNTNDMFIHMGVPSKRELGILLGYYQPYDTACVHAKHKLDIGFQKGQKHKYLFSQFSTEKYPQSYIDALLETFNKSTCDTGYFFTYRLSEAPKGSLCSCSCCS